MLGENIMVLTTNSINRDFLADWVVGGTLIHDLSISKIVVTAPKPAYCAPSDKC